MKESQHIPTIVGSESETIFHYKGLDLVSGIPYLSEPVYRPIAKPRKIFFFPFLFFEQSNTHSFFFIFFFFFKETNQTQ